MYMNARPVVFKTAPQMQMTPRFTAPLAQSALQLPRSSFRFMATDKSFNSNQEFKNMKENATEFKEEVGSAFSKAKDAIKEGVRDLQNDKPVAGMGKTVENFREDVRDGGSVGSKLETMAKNGVETVKNVAESVKDAVIPEKPLEAATNMGKSMFETAKSAVNTAYEKAAEVMGSMKSQEEKVENIVGHNVRDGARDARDMASNAAGKATDMSNKATNMASDLGSKAAAAASTLGSKAADVASNAANAASNAASKAAEMAKNAMGTDLGSKAADLGNKASNMASDAANKATNVAKDAMNSMKSEDLKDKANKAAEFAKDKVEDLKDKAQGMAAGAAASAAGTAAKMTARGVAETAKDAARDIVNGKKSL